MFIEVYQGLQTSGLLFYVSKHWGLLETLYTHNYHVICPLAIKGVYQLEQTSK